MNVINFFKFIESKKPEYSLKSMENIWKTQGVEYPYSGKGEYNQGGLKNGQFEKYSIFTLKNEPLHVGIELARGTGKGIFLSEVINYKNDVKDGPFIMYYPNGQIRSNTLYKNGNKEGEVKIYNQDGTVESKSFYENGIKNGRDESYNKNGDVIFSLDWVKGNKHGQEIQKTLNGKTVLNIVNYTDGIMNGPHLKFYENGKPQLKATLVNGYYIGDYELFHPNGKMKTYIDYKGPNRKKYRVDYRLDGTKESEEIFTDTHIILKTYYPNGNINSEKSHDKVTQKLDGLYATYSSDGKVMEKYVFDQNNIVNSND